MLVCWVVRATNHFIVSFRNEGEKHRDARRGRKKQVGRRACTMAEFHDKISVTDMPRARVLLTVCLDRRNVLATVDIYLHSLRFTLQYQYCSTQSPRAMHFTSLNGAFQMRHAHVELEMILHPAAFVLSMSNGACCDAITV